MNQFFTPLTEPVGALWGLMVLGVLWLLGHRQWRSAIWLGLPTVVLFVIGSTPLPEKLVASEERQWVEGKQITDYGLRTTGQEGHTSSGLRPPSPQGGEGKVNAEVEGQMTEVGKTENGKQITEIKNQIIEGGAQTPGTDKSEIGNRKSEMAFDAVVALGGGERVSQYDLLGFAQGDGGSRVLTAIELVRSGRARTLVLGGSWPMSGRPDVPSMSVVQAWVNSWGPVGGAVTNLGICINTHDEAVAFRKLARSRGWSKVLLVTSALHLRRAVALFKKQGMEVMPVAADFQVLGVPPEPFSPFPREQRLFLMYLYMHEKIGWWVYRARGWVGGAY